MLIGMPAGLAVAQPAPGSFVTVISDNPDNLNPYLHSLLDSEQVYRYVFDSLYRVNLRGAWEPALAVGERVSPDGLTWTYRLRPGVRWSDGQPFTSADVVYTWQLVTNKDVHISYATGFDKIARVDAPSPETVVFHLKEPYAPFREQVVGAPIVPRPSITVVRFPQAYGPCFAREVRVGSRVDGALARTF